MKFAWGFDTGGQHHRYGMQRKGRAGHRWIARRQGRGFGSGADTAVSIEREVVFGHAYAILAPRGTSGGACGYDNPANLPVDGVFNP
jgi:hypothetical protein